MHETHRHKYYTPADVLRVIVEVLSMDPQANKDDSSPQEFENIWIVASSGNRYFESAKNSSTQSNPSKPSLLSFWYTQHACGKYFRDSYTPEILRFLMLKKSLQSPWKVFPGACCVHEKVRREGMNRLESAGGFLHTQNISSSSTPEAVTIQRFSNFHAEKSHWKVFPRACWVHENVNGEGIDGFHSTNEFFAPSKLLFQHRNLKSQF